MAVAALVLALSLPAVAHASVMWQGTRTSPFSIQGWGGLMMLADPSGDPSLTLPYVASTEYANTTDVVFEPRSIRVDGAGFYYVAGGKGGYILKINPRTKSSTMITKDQIAGLFRPFDVYPLDDGGKIVVDRGPNALTEDTTGTGRVLRVDKYNAIQWTYRVDAGPGAGELWDPYTAEPVAGTANTLISDSLGHRVIEVDQGGNREWSYGQFRVEGPGPGLLNRPHSAERLANGNTLIADSGNHRVIEVTKAGTIEWFYGTGYFGSGPNELNSPNSAHRLADGNTLICDTQNNRVIVVNRQKAIVEAYGVDGRIPAGGAMDKPVSMLRLTDGATIIGDINNKRLVRYGYRPHREYVATSGYLDPSSSVAVKWFTRMTARVTVPAGSLATIEYTTDSPSSSSATWLSLPTGGVLPDATKGAGMAYRVLMSAGDAGSAPVLKDLSVTWTATAPSTGSSNNDNTSNTNNTSNTTKKSTTSNTTKKSTTTQSRRGSGTVDSSASGSDEATTVAPGGSASPLGAGMPGGGLSGTGSSGVKQTTTLSGWVMSEVTDAVGGTVGNSGTGGFGSGSTLQTSRAPALALLAAAYTLGLAWSPAGRWMVRAIVTAMTH